MRKNIQIFLSGSLIFLTFFMLSQIVVFAQTTAEKTAGEQAAAVGTNVSAAPSSENASVEGEGETVDEVSDPFVPSFPSKPEAAGPEKPSAQSTTEPKDEFDYSSLKVTGLVWGAEKPKAIIDGNVVGIGDTVKEAKILDISKEGIMFDYKGRQYLMKREGAGASLKSLTEVK